MWTGKVQFGGGEGTTECGLVRYSLEVGEGTTECGLEKCCLGAERGRMNVDW